MYQSFKTVLRLSALLLACSIFAEPVVAQEMSTQMPGQMEMTPEQMQMMHQLQAMAPARGYLDAHKMVDQPLGLLGGPIQIEISQDAGGVFVAMPDRRKLDTNVFGTPTMPRAVAGTAGINGLPPMARGVEDGNYTAMTMPSPFGDAFMVMGDGRLQINATDATATDAARTDDSVEMMASWKDEAGNTYEVRCCAMLAAHGMEFPTFGGVVTNHILHGFTRIGTVSSATGRHSSTKPCRSNSQAISLSPRLRNTARNSTGSPARSGAGNSMISSCSGPSSTRCPLNPLAAIVPPHQITPQSPAK